MADEKYNIEIALKAQIEATEKVKQALDEINRRVNEVSEQASNSGKAWTGAMMNIGAQISNLALKLPSLATATIRAFGEEEAALNKLSAAVRAQGGNVAVVLPIMQSFASEMQRITIVADDQILAMQGVATSMGVGAEQMDSVMKSAIGLSSALGMDMATATKAASAAIQGKTELLTRYIPMLSECKTSEEKFAKVQELSRSGFAQARAEADGTLGKLKQAANAWGDLAEVAGKTFAPVAVDVANLLKSISEWLGKNDEFTQLLVGSLSSLAVGFAFSRIGGIANVATLFKLLGGAIGGTKIASDALNMSLRANPIGIAVTAITAFGMVVSHLRSSDKKRYEENIKDSQSYRDALDAEIETLKNWGVSAQANKTRTSEISDEIARLKSEEAKYRAENGKTAGYQGYGGGGFYKQYSAEEQKHLDNLRAQIEKLTEVKAAYAPVSDLAAVSEKLHAEVLSKSNEILSQSNAEMRAANDARLVLKQTQDKYAETLKEVADIEAGLESGSITDNVRVAKTERLRQARLELVELGKQEIAQMTSLSDARYDILKTEELKKQYELETKLAVANLRGNASEAESLKIQLEDVKNQQRRLNLITSYIESLKSEIKTEEDLKRIKSEAQRYANSTLSAQSRAAEADKWLNSEVEASKIRQSSLETDILKARSEGNEIKAQELEKTLRIAHLSSEIFENTRKEGMSKQELIALQESAKTQAQERYDLEKSVTDEVERQNLAKNAQAKIEDILIANKIEQLKAEGNLTEAKELEREREIKRTLAGLEGVSDTDKETIADTMRQTNDYRDKQDSQRSSGAIRGNATGTRGYEDAPMGVHGRRNGALGYSAGTSFGRDSGVLGSSTSGNRKRNLAPSRMQGETWEQANARWAQTQSDKMEQKEQRAQERDKLNAMSPLERMTYKPESSSTQQSEMRVRVGQQLDDVSKNAESLSGAKRVSPTPTDKSNDTPISAKDNTPNTVSSKSAKKPIPRTTSSGQSTTATQIKLLESIDNGIKNLTKTMLG